MQSFFLYIIVIDKRLNVCGLLHCSFHFVGDFEVVVNGLYVVVLLKCVNHLQYLNAVSCRELLHIVGDALERSVGNGDFGLVKSLLECCEAFHRGVGNERFCAFLLVLYNVVEVLCAHFDEFHLEFVNVLAIGYGNCENAFPVKKERQRAVGAERAVALVEDRADGCHGAVVVVGEALDEHSHSAGSVTFEGDFLIVDSVACRLGDGALDVVLRDRGRLLLLQQRFPWRYART